MSKQRLTVVQRNNLLHTFQLSNEKPVKVQIGGVPKFLERLQEQIVYAEMEMKGEPLPMQGGEQRKIAPRLMHWNKGGMWFVTVLYGTMPVDLSGNARMLSLNNAAEYSQRAQATVLAGPSLNDVIRTYKTLIRAATDTKELEPVIEHVAKLIASKLERK